MKECLDCEYRGYSPEFCRLHIRHCARNQGHKRKPTPRFVKIGAKAFAGAGFGIAAVALGSAAASLVGGAVVLHAVMLKLGAGAGLAGGGVGIYKGLTGKKNQGADNASGCDEPVLER